MQLVFMGTSGFALPTLEALRRTGHQVLAVYTQPDRPAGRGLKPRPSPVKRLAQELEIPVVQPQSLRGPAAAGELGQLAPELAVVVAYGLLLPQAVLDVPRQGCINLHPSLLPKYRGAAPINWALINGETETGAVTIRMSARMDAGEVLEMERVAIGPDEDAGLLEERLALLGADLVLRTVDKISQGRAAGTAQDESLASVAPKLKPDDCRIRWAASGSAIRNLVRGTTPRPGAFTLFRGRRLEVGRIEAWSDGGHSHEPGAVAGLDHVKGPAVGTGDGTIILQLVKPEGKRMMTGAEFIRGYRPAVGERLE